MIPGDVHTALLAANLIPDPYCDAENLPQMVGRFRQIDYFDG
jgi:hypothetical protein